MPKLNQRGVIHLLLLLILIAGIIVGVYLVTQGNPLKLFSKATNPPIVFKDENGKSLPNNANGIPVTTSFKIKLELTSPLGPPRSGERVSGVIKTYTVSYKVTMNPTDFPNQVPIAYTQEPSVLDFQFKANETPGIKFIWVEFKDNTGKTDRRSAQIQLGSSSISSPIPYVPPTPPASTPTPISPTPAPDSCNGIGDVNSDGEINSTDSLIVLRIDGGLTKPTAEQKRRADVNGDGTVNSIDALIIQRYDAGFIKTFPVCVSKRVFVTSSGSDGNLKSSGSKFGLGIATSGLDGADKICQGTANIAKLGGTWKAWLSDGTTSASSRLKHNVGPYKLLNGTVVANNWNDLNDGTIQSKINITEYSQVKQNTIGDGPYVWTNTSASGGILSATRTCNNWTNMNIRRVDDAMVGKYSSTDAGWTNQGTDGILCMDNASTTGLALYCFEQ